MEFNPKVSIVIPVYNGSRYLREAIDSALAQTYTNVEIIVVNDGSNDDGKTEHIAKSYGNRIHYFYKENGWVASALNRGVREMTGDYLSWLSHDDVYYPNKLEVQLDYLAKCENKEVILFSDFDLIDHNSKLIGSVKIPDLGFDDFRWVLITSTSIHGCTTLVPRQCFQLFGYFDESIMTTQDYDLWFRIGSAFKFRHIPIPLIKSRLHADQGTNIMKETVKEECSRFYISCLDSLASELEPGSADPDKPPWLPFMKAALFLRLHEYFEPSSHAFNLAKKNTAWNSGPWPKAHWLFMESYYYMMEIYVRLKRSAAPFYHRIKSHFSDAQ
jgi:glycosyltransferase involved in cell wall biosynthesis